jgi:L-asparaginase
MSFAIMLKLAKLIDEYAAKQDVTGIVITHGTDTMEETAYFLNLVVKTDKPVVLVGSMRPSTAISADGPLNLYNGIAVAADPQAKGRGVLLVMNDWIQSAQTLIKVSTTAVQTFMSPIRGLIGTTAYGVSEYYRYPYSKFGSKSEFSVAGVEKLPRVDIIYADVDMPADLIDASVERGAKGIVIAGVGNGNMPAAALEACANASKKGVIVVRSTRVATGNVGRNVEVDDDKLGLIASMDLNPQKSRILLSMALLKPHSMPEIQKLFLEY